ncbi:MAG: hypothetical protein OER86_13635, partial [Phycisphaerae bacterium]|nr:hypothetical protein [Phycisphaerae bacterium]
YHEQTRLEEAADAHRRGMAEGTYGPAGRSNMLLCLNYLSSGTPQETFEAHREWAKQHAASEREQPPKFSNTPEPNRRLRIGYVSPDFRAHSVNYFFEPLLRAHDSSEVEVFCYANVRQADHVTARVQSRADHWRNLLGADDLEAAERIRRDEIDVLIDLAGHTAGHRLGVFSRRPAPVQVTYLGYPNTTGLGTIDYRITDDLADPPGKDDRWYSEALVRLPACFLCYQPPDEAPDISPPPCRERGYITFASFNNLAKVSPQVIQAWARILERVAGAKLMLKGKPLDDAGTRARFLDRFAERGIGPDRLELVGWVEGNYNHLTAYRDVDIALDTFPYNGTKTTCESMWMGVPVVTVRGDRHAGRVGATLLHHVGRDQFVAEDEDAYVAIAANLAERPGDLADLRRGFRDRLRGSELCDAARFARGFESALRQMWERWCADETSRSE